MIGLLSYRKCR